MNEENGSAEQQAERIRERATQANAPLERRVRSGSRGLDREHSARRLLHAGRQLLARPEVRMIAGIALLVGSAALIAVREAQARPSLRSLRRRARAAVTAFREPGRAAGSRGIGVFTGLAALALARTTWRQIAARDRPRSEE